MEQPSKIEIAVYIPDADVKKWLLFQQYYEVFCLLLNSGVFNQKKASITLHFDPGGNLETITRADFLYSKRSQDKLSTLDTGQSISSKGQPMVQ